MTQLSESIVLIKVLPLKLAAFLMSEFRKADISLTSLIHAYNVVIHILDTHFKSVFNY